MREYLDLYVEELLKSRKIPADDAKFIKKFVHDITTCLKNNPKKNVFSLAETLTSALDEKEEKLNYRPPNSVHETGNHAWNTAYVKSCVDVDVLVEIPSDCIHSKDHLNEAVLRRRAQYLKHVAAVLMKADLASEVKYFYPNSNNKKPLLAVYPKEKSPTLDQVRILIHTSYEKGTFKLNRFHVAKNNVRRKFYFPESNVVDSEEGSPTPYYNSLVLADLTISDNKLFIKETLKDRFAVQQAVVLLQIWLERRHLNKGFQADLFLSAFVAYLSKQGIIKDSMKPMDVFKITLQKFCQTDLKTCGITLFEGEESNNQPSVNDFHQHFNLVFVDSTGFWNICADLNTCQYDNMKYEAEETLKLLNTSDTDLFQRLFLNEYSFPCKFDHILHIGGSEVLKQLCESRKSLQESVLNYAGNHMVACVDSIVNVLRRALGERVRLIGYLPPRDAEIKVVRKICSHENILPKKLTFGLLIDKFHASNSEIKGPSANLEKEVHEFQKFWGEKAEQHRYHGGEIIECVKWPVNTAADGRTIVARIIKFILNRHFNITKEDVSISGNQLDKLLKPAEGKNSSEVSIYGTGEEQHNDVIKALEQLRGIITSIKDLPLAFNSTCGISPIFRFTEVFPPVKSASQYDSSVYNHRLVPVANGRSPQHFPSMKVLCMMERSGAWPKDREAVRKLKGRFYVEMAEHLEKAGYTCHASLDGLSIYKPKETFTFQVEIGYMREIAESREFYVEGGVEMVRDSKESDCLRRNYVHLPEFMSLMHSLYQQNNSFSCAVRLAKRWLSSQLLHSYVPEEAIELCMAYIYTSNQPPSSPLLGFIQFLHLVSTHDWKLEPLIVNLNNGLTESDYEEIRKNFSDRRSSLPDMFIATPDDKNSAIWTASQPSSIFLARLAMLAKVSLNTLCELIMNPPFNQKDFKVLFRPPTSDYNLLIHLEPSKCSRAHLGVDFYYDSSNPPPKKSSRPDNLLPVIDYDLPVLYLQDLKEKFSDLALFFYDIYGGKYIAVAWKASAFKPQPLKKNHEKYFKVIEESLVSGNVCMKPDEEKIITEFHCLGLGIVTDIKVLKKLNL